MSLYEKALRGLENTGVGLEGAADELSFGLYDKYVPGARERGKEHNWSKNAGRVGSYFIPMPLPSKLKAAVRAPEALRELIALIKASKAAGLSTKAAVKAGELASKNLATKAVAGAAKGAAHGVASGEVQHGARSLLNTHDPELNPASTEDRLATEALFGVGGRALGAGAKALAPWVYNHPALMNKFKPEYSEEQARELLDKGVFGRLKGGFRDHAQKLKDEAGGTFKKIHERVSSAERQHAQEAAGAANLAVPHGPRVRPPKGMTEAKSIHGQKELDIREGKRSGMLPSEQNQYDEAYRSAEQALSPDMHGLTSVDEISNSLKANNTRIANLKAEARAKAQGAQGLGDNTAEIDRVKSLKSAHEKVYKDKISEYGDDADLLRYNKARAVHRKGADLEGNIRTHEILNSNSNPGFMAPDWWRNIARFTVGSAPIRSSLGIILDRASRPGVSSAGGRIGELRSRNNGEQPVQSEPGQDLLFDLPPPAQDGAEQGAQDPDAQEAARKKFGIKKGDLEAINKMPLRKAKSAEYASRETTAENALDELDDENLLIKLPPPR